MKVLIIEDEKPASRKLVRLLEEIDPQIEVAGILASVEQATNWFTENPSPDLVLMDIQLEDGTCFEIFENSELRTPVIFTTAYDEYTLKAFKVNSVDYLLKPVNRDDLKKAMDKFDTLHRQKIDYSSLESIVRQLQSGRKERFLVKVGEHFRSVPTSQIICFYIRERSNFIFTDTGRSYPLDHSLDRIEQLVDPVRFFRINRNFMISYPAIKDVIAYSSSRLKVVLSGWNETGDILVSRERVTAFKQWMDR